MSDDKVMMLDLSMEEIRSYIGAGATFERGPIVDKGDGKFSQDVFIKFPSSHEFAALLAKNRRVTVIKHIGQSPVTD